MCAAIGGRSGKVMYGSVTLANIKEWSMSGFSKPAIEIPAAFGDTIATYRLEDTGKPGTISFNGNYDPGDAAGQIALAAVCIAGTALTDLYLYVNTSTFWRVGSNGTILVTKADAVTLPRSGIGTISFEGQVSGDNMECVGTGT